MTAPSASGYAKGTDAVNGPRHSRNTPLPHVEAVRRRCEVCEWEGELIQPVGAEPDCPWCHAPTIRVVILATSTHSAEDAARGKNPHAAALGRLGGAKGGRARARALTPHERREIASRAARARWTAKKPKKKGKKKSNR